MIEKLKQLKKLIGDTPVIKLRDNDYDIYAKLEYTNFSGSIKDRAAYNILRTGIEDGSIGPDTTIVESSSGNFAVALTAMCNFLGLKFIPVIDPFINEDYEQLLRLMNPYVEKVDCVDENKGYLLSRLRRVEELCESLPSAYWTNQYGNPSNYKAYYDGLAIEMAEELSRLDYLFLSVSSGGTITGTSMRLKEIFPNLKVIAVDIEGSVIFGQRPKKRRISGLGSSIRPKLLDNALIDEVIHISEMDIIKGCNDLLNEQMLFCGGSSGAAYAAIKHYKSNRNLPKGSKIAFVAPDKGTGYLKTVYNPDWAFEPIHDLVNDY